ncbi:hypothetical protein [Jannaschia formosa]|uniref:hypothetical protein n=1 Tax=Jannaschia formosa TaxID=2259592 RepID=UPI000E1B61DB|nr:hypothetical protein [Jannaschia formosa]TFL16040.1 hypothetical protein DR046_22090 [Jannaschia formosa]
MIQVADIDAFQTELRITYRGETYLARDNGAVLRRAREGRRIRPLDETWTFGNPFTEEETRALSEIIAAFNDRHGTDFSEEDYVRFEAARADIVADEDWAARLRNNAPGDVRPHFDTEFMRRAIQAFQRDNEMRNAFLTDEEARRMLMDLMFRRAVREAGEAA